MKDETLRYLDLIGEHLRERHASVLVGAGFSRNAIKVDDSVPDSPDWEKLGEIFIKKLTADADEQRELSKLSPLVLAERVEAIYGRPELDRILLTSIRNEDVRPSALHYKLLKLPWSDIFTTNYDTLLEETSKGLTEQAFKVITCKEDLIGSSGSNRIIKLHGSFPSQRPFIISSEDYRTYPQVFAPFVNTVQQSMLENTLCLIGFSGNDPNFEKWTGWIRDNLGRDNSPNIYLLTHQPLSEAEKKLLFRKKIIPVDLSQLMDSPDVSKIYERALDHLLEKQSEDDPGKWDLSVSFYEKTGAPISCQAALDVLKKCHASYPGWLTVPNEKLPLLRRVVNGAQNVLMAWCKTKPAQCDIELEFLYEYDWFREKTLLPPFEHELNCYHMILDRHPESSFHKYAIQLSLLRDFRESGDWEQWDTLYAEVYGHESDLSIEQLHHLHWEECRCTMARYRYKELKLRLDTWYVEPGMSVWALRKAGLLAECGERKEARIVLQSAIVDIRRRLAYRKRTDLSLLSVESAMMVLQSFINQASHEPESHIDAKKADDIELADRRHRALHDQYHVDWDRQNTVFEAWMEAPWVPFRVDQSHPSFDFGAVRRSSRYGEDKEVIRAYTFLRFREDTGVPYFLNSVHAGTKAACGAAERIALYSPFWSIQILILADGEKAVEQVITRSVLSTWTQEDADQWCKFYADALLKTEDELSVEDWFYRRTFARLAASVLPQVLSELCYKCSVDTLRQLLDALKKLYVSDKRMCYNKLSVLAKRLVKAYPVEQRGELLNVLLAFPIISNEQDRLELENPFSYLPITDAEKNQILNRGLPEIEMLFAQCGGADDTSKEPVLDRLLYCMYHGLLTHEQKIRLRDLLWNGQQFCGLKHWLRTICLDLPAPENVDVPHYLAEVLVGEIIGYTGEGLRPNNDIAILREIQNLIIFEPSILTNNQISAILSAFVTRVYSLSTHIGDKLGIVGLGEIAADQMYQIAHIFWLLIGAYKAWIPSEADLQSLRCLLEGLEKSHIRHCGFHYVCCEKMGIDSDMANDLAECFRSVEGQEAHWGFEMLAVAIRRPKLLLMEDSAIRIGLDSCAQQIAWGVPKLLPFALQALTLAATYKPDLISKNALDAILSSLSQLKKQTAIGAEDTIDSACTKGHVRENAAALAKALHCADLGADKPEILAEWIDIINDKNEFAEIRNAGI